MLALLFTIAIIGCIAYLIYHHVPMLEPFKTAILVIAVLACIWIVWRALGMPDIPLR